MNFNHFISELKRRNVIKVGIAYAITGWLIIQVMDTVSPQLNFPDWIAPFFTIVVLCLFPIVLIVAWAFEITPEGIKPTVKIEPKTSMTKTTGKKINKLIIASLSLALIFMVVERTFFAGGALIAHNNEEMPSIAVLPFVNMSSDVENEYFSDGLSEELLNVLAKVEDLRVAGRTSSFKFKGQNDNLTKIGNELQVSHILEGSVRKSSNTIRVTAQLIKVSNGFHVWSETYDRELTSENLFLIQDEISHTVLNELKVRMLAINSSENEEKPLTENLEAYDAYLKASQLIIGTDIRDIEEAITLYKKAIKIDPQFTDAYARLAKAYYRQHTYGNIELDVIKELMRENIDKALLLDGNSARALDAQGRYYILIEDNELMLSTYEKAIKLMPNDGDVLDGYHIALESNNQVDKSTEVLKKAYELDPLNPGYATHYSNHLASDDPQQALEILNAVIKKNPEYSDAYFAKAHLISSDKFKDMGKGFELVYEGYSKKPEDVMMMSALFSSAVDMAMSELALSIEDRMLELYPKNQMTLSVQFGNRLLEHNFTAVEEILKTDNDHRFISEKDKAHIKSLMSFIKKEYKNALEYYILFDSAYTTDTLRFEEPIDVVPALEYATLLKVNNKKAAYDSLTNKICDFTNTLEVKEGKELEYKYAQFACYALTDENKATDLLREMYFEDYDKRHTPSTLELNIAFLYLAQNPKFNQLKKEIYNDLNTMSAEAIESLRKSGVWKEDRLNSVDLDRIK